MSAPDKVFVVHNPVAGTSDFESARAAIAEHFETSGVAYEYYVTGPDDPVPEIVRDAVARGFDLIVVAGGDGTISAAVNGLAGADARLGVIPLGSGNAFVRECDIPLDMEAALALLTNGGRERRLDTLLVGERHFVLNVSTGLSSEAIAETDRAQKRRIGKLAYLFEGLGRLGGMHLERFTIFVDGRRIRARASEIIAANSGVIGFKGVRLSPQVRPDDGLMHVCIVQADTLGSYLRLLAGALRGNPAQLPELHCLPAKDSVRIESDRPLAVQGDGEGLGTTPVEVGIDPGSLQVLVPAA